MRAIPHREDLPIIITGTIVPQSNFVKIHDWTIRREQYLAALRYFCASYKVYFLENSTYDIDADKSFDITNLSVVRSRECNAGSFRLGKGYQEFKMLDDFLTKPGRPARFIKITGRRILKQIVYFQKKYSHSRYQWFDLWENDCFADTTFFCCDTAFYDAHIRGLYAQADDSTGKIIEHVVYSALCRDPLVRFHPRTPLYEGFHGTSGNPLKGRYHFPTEARRFCRALLLKHKMNKKILF